MSLDYGGWGHERMSGICKHHQPFFKMPLKSAGGKKKKNNINHTVDPMKA